MAADRKDPAKGRDAAWAYGILVEKQRENWYGHFTIIFEQGRIVHPDPLSFSFSRSFTRTKKLCIELSRFFAYSFVERDSLATHKGGMDSWSMPPFFFA
jgi:hypothetical protein